MRSINRLSSRFVTTTKAKGYHADGGGLYLIVDENGAKRWAFIFQWRKKRKEMGLGSLLVVGLLEARVKADAARKMVANGTNPIDERKRAQGLTFKDASEDLIQSLKAGWRGAKTEDGWRNTLFVHAQAIGEKHVAEVTTEDVLGVLKDIWASKPETAQKLRGRIETVLDAAKAKGQIPSPWENPARWKGHLQLMLPKPQKLSRGHHAAMPYNELPAFLAELRERQAMAARALEFTILTAARTEEVIGAPWSEFDLEAKLWIIPKERMKGHREHRVPLSEAAIRALGERGDGYVFGYDDRLSNMAMDMLLRRMGPEVTVHGFRSTFRDWAGDKTDFPEEIAEAALAHVGGSAVKRAYRRGDALDRRRALMVAWAGYCYPTPPAAEDPPQE